MPGRSFRGRPTTSVPTINVQYALLSHFLIAGGYGTKDHGQSHYRLGVINVSQRQLAIGATAWLKRKNSYNSTGFMLTRTNMFGKCYTCYETHFRGLNDMSLLQVSRLIMLKPTERHVPDPNWCQRGQGGGWNYTKAELLFALSRTVIELLPEVSELYNVYYSSYSPYTMRCIADAYDRNVRVDLLQHEGGSWRKSNVRPLARCLR